MENNKETQLSELIKMGLLHSIAQAFLIFSGILVIVSLKTGVREYINLAFFTLFYALINFKIEAIRRHPPLGNYAMRDNLGSGLYTIISGLLLIWWIVGLVLLLNCVPLADIFFKIPYFLLSIVWLFALGFWIGLIFNRKRKKNNSALNEKDNKIYYEVDCCCQNCNLKNEKVKIPIGIKVVDIICPKCGIAQQLERKKDKNKPITMLCIEFISYKIYEKEK